MADFLIPTPALSQWVEQLWRAAGSDADEARLTAEHLVGANLAGHDSHGVGMLPRYVASWQAGELQLNRRLALISDGGTMLCADAQRGMGQSLAAQAMTLAIERAREHGVCVLGLRQAHHIGRVGHWAEQAVAAGMVSLHFVNVLGRSLVAPFGGSQARLSTNPFTVGIPVPGREPIVLDMATSAIAMGKVRVALQRGEPVPADTLIDAHGEPSRDPAVMFPPAGEPAGALLPFAGHKGYALAMVCELLGAALFGGDTARPAHLGARHAVWNNMLTLVFDPARLHTQAPFAAEVGAFVDWVQSSPRRHAGTPIVLPGDPERACRRARARHVPLDAATLAELDAAAAQVAAVRGVALPALSSLQVPGG